MTISYPLSLPATKDPATVRMIGNEIVAGSASPYTGQQQIYDWQAPYWRAEITVPPMNRQNAAPWIAFLLALRGRAGTFLMGDPGGRTARGALGGTPLVMGGSQTGYTLVIDGATAGVTGWLKAGDYVQLGNYMYAVLADANSNGSGQVTLDIWPRLRSSPADNAAVTTANTKGLWRLMSNERSWNETPGIIYRDITLAAIEAI